MHGQGHVGIGLALYAPVGALLVPTGDPWLRSIGLLAVAVTAVLPDVDEHLPIPHRGPTHTVVFVVLVVLVAGAVGMTGGVLFDASPTRWGGVIALAAAIGAGSHLAVDGVTPMGIRPFWPVASRRYTLDLVPSKHAGLNATLLAIGLAATVALFAIGGG